MLCAAGACLSGEETKTSDFNPIRLHISKIKGLSLKDKPQDVEIVTEQCFWFLNS